MSRFGDVVEQGNHRIHAAVAIEDRVSANSRPAQGGLGMTKTAKPEEVFRGSSGAERNLAWQVAQIVRLVCRVVEFEVGRDFVSRRANHVAGGPALQELRSPVVGEDTTTIRVVHSDAVSCP